MNGKRAPDGPVWWLTKDGDVSCLALYERHYSCYRYADGRTVDELHHARRAAGKKLRDERVAKGQSLLEAAKERGISPAELSAIEHGKLPLQTRLQEDE